MKLLHGHGRIMQARGSGLNPGRVNRSGPIDHGCIYKICGAGLEKSRPGIHF